MPPDDQAQPTIQELIRQRSALPLQTLHPNPNHNREVASRLEYDPATDLVEIRIVSNLYYAEVMLETATVQVKDLKRQLARQQPSQPIPLATPQNTPANVMEQWRLF